MHVIIYKIQNTAKNYDMLLADMNLIKTSRSKYNILCYLTQLLSITLPLNTTYRFTITMLCMMLPSYNYNKREHVQQQTHKSLDT